MQEVGREVNPMLDVDMDRANRLLPIGGSLFFDNRRFSTSRCHCA